MDSVWRLTKSHADEHMDGVERKRQERGARANLNLGGGAQAQHQEKVQLGEDEARVAAGMGISPEHYKQYEVPGEVEPGGLVGKKR